MEHLLELDAWNVPERLEQPTIEPVDPAVDTKRSARPDGELLRLTGQRGPGARGVDLAVRVVERIESGEIDRDRTPAAENRTEPEDQSAECS